MIGHGFNRNERKGDNAMERMLRIPNETARDAILSNIMNAEYLRQRGVRLVAPLPPLAFTLPPSDYFEVIAATQTGAFRPRGR